MERAAGRSHPALSRREDLAQLNRGRGRRARTGQPAQLAARIPCAQDPAEPLNLSRQGLARTLELRRFGRELEMHRSAEQVFAVDGRAAHFLADLSLCKRRHNACKERH